jgi:hypothetical protein
VTVVAGVGDVMTTRMDHPDVAALTIRPYRGGVERAAGSHADRIRR